MIFILDKKEKVVNTLKNNYSSTSGNPYFNDVLQQDLATGAESYSFSTFANGTIANDLVIGNYIAFKHKNSYKLFQITNVEIVHEESMEISVYSECAGLTLLNNVFRSRKMTSCTLRQFIDAVVENTDWETGLIEEAVNSVDLDIETTSCYSALQQNISNFGVELEFRVEINHGRVSKKYIDTYKQRGRITGKRFTYGRDIEKVVKTINSEQLYTALIGEGKNGETFRDIVVDGIDKPLGQDFVADQESFEKYNRNGYHLMGVYSVDSDVPEIILRKTYEKLQEVKNPKISYEIPVIMLGELLGLEWDEVSIGDQIGILDTEFNPPLMLSARVSNLQISKSNPESSTCTLSNFIEVASNITDEMRKIASKLEGYVDNKFPIGSDDIQEGAVNGTHMDKKYMTQITADIVQASLIKANEIITNEITAVNGRFETIETDVLKANEIAADAIKANTITAGRVDAVEGNFSTLNAAVGTIGTLVNGNLTSDNIQAGGITGDRLNMDTVFVNDANIINVSASKINAGQVNTNKVTIQSDNGGIVIADNTQQFRDKNGKVRIQMGQDATGEFTFGVFDETGTGTLIDSTGVKEKALADGIIKDRMIGEGEIGGAKIDISSLITEVNKDTNTEAIKGSKVLLDTEGQRLDVAFSSLKNVATDAKSASSSNTTQIGIEQGRIDTLIANTTIEKEDGNITLKDAYSETAQTVSSLKTTVGEHETKWTENEKFVSTTKTTLEQLTDKISLKVESSYVEEVFENTIKSVDVQYYLSTSSSTLTGGSWSTSAPAWQKGKYIWTKTVTTYMSGLTQETTPVCISGVNGQDGADGKGIKSVVEQYYLSTSNTTQTGGTWENTPQAWVNGKYMWTRSIITYTDNTTTTTSPVCVTGSKGDKGDKGDNGSNGVGISSVDVEYYLSTSSTALSGGSWSTSAPTWVNGKYMWSRTKTVNTTGTATYSNPACITGAKGSTGATGATGKGVKSTTVTYQASTSGTTVPTGSWTTTIPTVSAGQYLWTRTIITYTDDTNTTSYSIGKMGEQGATGQNGTNGVGVKSTSVTYQASTSGTTTPTGTWSTTIPTVSAGQYLWTRTIITYTNGTSATSYSIGKMGEQGPTGATGVGIKSVVNYYLASASASGVTTSTSGWTTTVQTINTTNKYLWNYEKITYTNNSTSSTDPVIIGVHGTNGVNGAAGKGISSITEYYLVSSAATGITTSTSGWTTTVPSMTTTNRYLWNYEAIKYTDNSTTTGTPKVIGVYGNTGATGATGTGISSITEEYYLSTSKTTQTGGSWTTTPPTWSVGKYVWTRSKIVYSNPTSTAYTTPICDSSWEAVNDIEVGARNLITLSTLGNGGNMSAVDFTEYPKSGTVTMARASGNGNGGIRLDMTLGYTANTNYVLRFKMKRTSGVVKNIYFHNGQGLLNTKMYVDGVYVRPMQVIYTTDTFEDGEYHEVLVTFTTPASLVDSSTGTNQTYFQPNKALTTDVYGVTITELKLEKGNKATDWSPAPEDITNAISVVEKKASDAILEVSKDKIIQKVSDTFTTKTESTALKNQLDQNKQNIRCNNVGAKINYSSFSTPNSGEIYLHGYDNNNNPIDANGLIYWNGTTVSVPKGTINPNSDFGTGNDVYIFMNRTNSSVLMGGYYDASTKAWKYKHLIGGTSSGTFTPVIDHVALGMFNMKDAETFNYAFLFDNPQSLRNLTVGVADLITRMNSAEQKITSDAIVNTVKNHQTNGTNTFATSSQLTQTADSITAKFTGTGGFNILKNSDAKNGTYMWSGNGKTLTIGTSGSSPFMGGNEFKSTFPNGLKYSENIKLKANTEYVYEAWVYTDVAYSGSATAPMHFWCNTTAGASGQAQAEILDYRQKLNANAFTKVYVHFRTKGGDVYFTPFIYGGATDSMCVARQISLREGKVEMPWTPHPSEVYEGSTIIDGSGVTVKNGALKVQNNAGQTVLSGDSNGNLNLTSIGSGLSTNMSSGRLVLNNTSTGAHMDLEGTTIKLYDYSTIDERAEISKSTGKLTISSWSQKVVPSIDLNTDTVNIPNKLNMSGALVYKGNTILNGSDTWLRTYGETGWFNGTYGGGWYMTDYNWIRAYNNKSIYTSSNIQAGGHITCSKIAVGSSPDDTTFNAPWYGLGRTNYTCGVSGINAVQLGGYGGITLRTVNTIFELRGDNYILSQGHLCPFNTRSNWLGTNSPDRQWKGVCCEGGTVGASDIRAKENIERLDGTIVTYDEVSEKLNEYQLSAFKSSTRAVERDYYEFVKDRFKPVYYNYKLTEHINEESGEYVLNPEDEYNMLKNVGFLAQDYDLETDKVAQEFIFKNEDGTLSYNHMSYVTVGMIALQEAAKKIDALKEQNENLQTKNKELEDRLKILEDLILTN